MVAPNTPPKNTSITRVGSSSSAKKTAELGRILYQQHKQREGIARVQPLQQNNHIKN